MGTCGRVRRVVYLVMLAVLACGQRRADPRRAPVAMHPREAISSPASATATLPLAATAAATVAAPLPAAPPVTPATGEHGPYEIELLPSSALPLDGTTAADLAGA